MVLACRHAASQRGSRAWMKERNLVLDNWLFTSVSNFFIFIYVPFPFLTGKLIWEIFAFVVHFLFFKESCFFFVIVGL